MTADRGRGDWKTETGVVVSRRTVFFDTHQHAAALANTRFAIRNMGLTEAPSSENEEAITFFFTSRSSPVVELRLEGRKEV